MPRTSGPRAFTISATQGSDRRKCFLMYNCIIPWSCFATCRIIGHYLTWTQCLGHLLLANSDRTKQNRVSSVKVCGNRSIEAPYTMLHPLVSFCNTQNSLNLLNLTWQCLESLVLRHDLREFKAPRSHYNLLIDVSSFWLDSTQNHYRS